MSAVSQLMPARSHEFLTCNGQSVVAGASSLCRSDRLRLYFNRVEAIPPPSRFLIIGSVALFATAGCCFTPSTSFAIRR